MGTEIERTMAALGSEDPPLYYLSYEVTVVKSETIRADIGEIINETASYSASLDMDLRVGSPELDNTHRIADDRRVNYRRSIPIPLDSIEGLRTSLWSNTHEAYIRAVDALQLAQEAQGLQNEEDPEEKHPDFVVAAPSVFTEESFEFQWDAEPWRQTLTEVSGEFRDIGNEIQTGSANLSGNVTDIYFANSEGSAIKQASRSYMFAIEIAGLSPKGELMNRGEQFFATTLGGLPSESELIVAAHKLESELFELFEVDPVPPFTGPAILSGRASGVFFHEILGHRLEGHRLKETSDSQTFKEKIGSAVLPETFSVIFDPTIAKHRDQDLMGFYRFDNQGVAARRLPVIENGILKTFLMSRSPLFDIPNSNGHGRKAPGYTPVARQSNLFVEAEQTLTEAELKAELLRLVEAQGLEFGLYFDDVRGGFTFTGRGMPNAFNVTPTMVYKIYPDGNEELVRGVNLIGTPLSSFTRITAASDTPQVFNGWCGAESGPVPVSAISPSILVSEVEVQRKEVREGLLPILPPPSQRNEG